MGSSSSAGTRGLAKRASFSTSAAVGRAVRSGCRSATRFGPSAAAWAARGGAGLWAAASRWLPWGGMLAGRSWRGRLRPEPGLTMAAEPACPGRTPLLPSAAPAPTWAPQADASQEECEAQALQRALRHRSLHAQLQRQEQVLQQHVLSCVLLSFLQHSSRLRAQQGEVEKHYGHRPQSQCWRRQWQRLQTAEPGLQHPGLVQSSSWPAPESLRCSWGSLAEVATRSPADRTDPALPRPPGDDQSPPQVPSSPLRLPPLHMRPVRVVALPTRLLFRSRGAEIR